MNNWRAASSPASHATYTPYVGIEDNNQGFQGETFQDLLTNFPLATTFTTAEWLEYEIHSPDGHTETFTREVKDLIGAATRRLGGSPQLALGTSSGPFFGPEDIYVNWVLPNAVSEWAAQRQAVGVLVRLKEAGAISQSDAGNRQPFAAQCDLDRRRSRCLFVGAIRARCLCPSSC